MNDFEEMLLHHIATTSLCFAYIFGNMLYIGSLIAYLHNVSDVVGKVVKLLNSTIYQDASAVSFIVCMFVWFVTRNWSLPQLIYHIFTTLKYPPGLEQFQPYIFLNGVFLCVLCALHYYWFAMFCRILLKYAITGKADDDQNKVEKKSGSTATTTNATASSSPRKGKGRPEKLD